MGQPLKVAIFLCLALITFSYTVSTVSGMCKNLLPYSISSIS